ncbi:hypothetical protein ABPG75_005785 [Micractinium tetrahymenae]
MSGQQLRGTTDVPGAEATELRSAQWQIEREEEGAVKEQLAQGDKEAAQIEENRDRQDPDYDPSNPAEERRGNERIGPVRMPAPALAAAWTL